MKTRLQTLVNTSSRSCKIDLFSQAMRPRRPRCAAQRLHTPSSPADARDASRQTRAYVNLLYIIKSKVFVIVAVNSSNILAILFSTNISWSHCSGTAGRQAYLGAHLHASWAVFVTVAIQTSIVQNS